MFTVFYFPLVSSLASESLSKGLREMLREGHISSSAFHISRIADSCHDESHAAAWRQLQADLQAAFGLHVDAEESYRQSQRMIRTGKHDLHVASSRNAGWQAFFRHRFATAMACFRRLTEERDVELRFRLEGLFGLLSVQLELGHARAATEALEVLRTELEVSVQNQDSLDEWVELIRTLRVDIGVQCTLRSAPQLSDHVYWRSALSREPGLSSVIDKDLTGEIAALLASIRSPILRARISYLASLHRLSEGKLEAMDDLTAHLNWAAANGLAVYQRIVREEIALASIAGGAPHVAEIVLSALSAENRHAHDYRHLEYLYCLAKTRQAQGRSYDALMLYSRYALSAMQCLRDASKALAYAQRIGQSTEMLDDVAARLPAKYRRGYRYILENLERSDLTVQEIAAEIGVTARALQSAFKSSLGVTPREVIRQRRMERIRAELQSDEKHLDKGVQEVASRWGVRHRTSLATGYRSQYNEVPSDTLKSCPGDLTASAIASSCGLIACDADA